MVYEFVQLLGSILAGGIAGGAVASWLSYRFNRRCTSLEWAIGDLQQRASTFKGREMADKRWKKAEIFEQEFEQALKTPTPANRRYDNDPLGG